MRLIGPTSIAQTFNHCSRLPAHLVKPQRPLYTEPFPPPTGRFSNSSKTPRGSSQQLHQQSPCRVASRTKEHQYKEDASNNIKRRYLGQGCISMVFSTRTVHLCAFLNFHFLRKNGHPQNSQANVPHRSGARRPQSEHCQPLNFHLLRICPLFPPATHGRPCKFLPEMAAETRAWQGARIPALPPKPRQQTPPSWRSAVAGAIFQVAGAISPWPEGSWGEKSKPPTAVSWGVGGYVFDLKPLTSSRGHFGLKLVLFGTFSFLTAGRGD